MPSSYNKAKHIVEVDEKILAVFIVDSAAKISDLFIAEDANIDRSFIETVRFTLNIRLKENKKGQKNNHWENIVGIY